MVALLMVFLHQSTPILLSHVLTVLLATGPSTITGFFFIAITFRLSATSPKIHWIYSLSTNIIYLYIPSNMRLLESAIAHREKSFFVM